MKPGSQRHRGLLLAAFALLSLMPLVAAAQAPGVCGSGAPQTWLAACTAIIDDPSASAAEHSRALKLRGVAAYQLGQIDQAGADFSAATTLAPDDAEAWSNLAMVRQARGDFEGALTDYDKAIALDPKSWVAHLNRGNALRLRGNATGAIADYDMALMLKPDLEAALRGRSIARQMRGDLNGAIADASAALQLDPRDGEALLSRGTAFRLQGNADKALADYEEATRVRPDMAGAWLDRGAVLMEKGSLDAAIESFDRAIGLNAGSVEAYNNRGAAESQKGDFARATSDLDTAVRLGPNSQEAHGNRAFVRLALGDFKGADEDFTWLAMADPGDPYRILWRHIARARAGETDDGFAREAAAAANGEWPGPLLALYLGALDREKAMLIGPEVAAAERGERRCEIAFYVGQHALASNDRAAAVSLIREAAETCPLGALERVAAIGEWRRLQP